MRLRDSMKIWALACFAANQLAFLFSPILRLTSRAP
jgi:hypothetical protein